MLDTFNPLFQSLLPWFSDSALWVLFFSGFLSATLLPGSSEASFITVLNLNQFSVFAIILSVTFGNTLGGLSNFWLGLCLPNRTQNEKYAHKALLWLNKFGYWALIFSWLPVIGDPLCLAAGWLRMRFWPCFSLILIGKALRYLLLAAIFYGLF